MIAMPKRTLKILAVLLALLVLFFAVMYAATPPKFSIPATVTDDVNLPAIMINGIRLHAETFGRGDAPVVIVLHGGPGNDYKYLLSLRVLADRYRVVFYDQRGAGLSQRVPGSALNVDDYLAELDGVVEHYSADAPVLLVGHSWGAMLATAYLGKHPQKVEAAVLAEPGFLNSELAETFYGKTNRMMPPISAGLVWHVVRTWFESLHVAGPDADASRDYLIQQITEAEVEGHPIAGYFCGGKLQKLPTWRFGSTALMTTRIIADDEGRIRIDLVSGVDRYEGRVLFLSGSCNVLSGPEHQRKQMRFFRHAELAVIEGAGHPMFSDKPAESLAAVRNFLGSLHAGDSQTQDAITE